MSRQKEKSDPPSSDFSPPMSISGGWAVDIGESLRLTLTQVSRKSGRGRVAIAEGGIELYHLKHTLDSELSRSRTLKTLQARTNEPIPKDALVALERMSFAPAPSQAANAQPDAPPVVDPPVSLGVLIDEVTEVLRTDDRDAVHLMLAAVTAHRIQTAVPVWLLLVASPSSAKTALLSLLDAAEDMYPIGKLTGKTFVSGLDTHDGVDHSLLPRVDQKVLILKDMTTLLQLRHEEQQEIFAQLREIYDGALAADDGIGKSIRWTGRVGLLGGVTQKIEERQSAMATLGPRFLLLRLRPAPRGEVAARAIENALSGQSRAAWTRCQARVVAWLRGIPQSGIAVPDDVKPNLIQIADFVTAARSAVARDGYKETLQYAPDPEAPARFAKQMVGLLQGIAAVDHRTQIRSSDLALAVRVALDTVPMLRMEVLYALALQCADGTWVPTAIVAKHAGPDGRPTDTAKKYLEDLQALGLVDGHKAGEHNSAPMTWRLKPDTYDTLAWFSEIRLPEPLSPRGDKWGNEEPSAGDDNAAPDGAAGAPNDPMDATQWGVPGK